MNGNKTILNGNIHQDLKAYSKDNVYDYDNNIMLNYYPRRIIQKLDIDNVPKNKLLELGLGHGYSTMAFYGSFEYHTVIDGDARIIDKFWQEHPTIEKNKLKTVESYFENYKTADKYDVIVAGFVLEHVDDPLQIIKLYKKMLTIDGRLYIAVPNAECLHRRLGHIAGLLDNIESLSATDQKLGHKRYFKVDTIRELVIKSGMKLKSIEGLFLKPFTTRQLMALSLSESVINALCEIGKDYPELCAGILVECELE